MKKGAYHLGPGSAADREELRDLMEQKAAPGKLSTQEISDGLSVLADAAEETGKPIWAERIRGVAVAGSMLTSAEEVVRRWKVGWTRAAQDPWGERRSGRTTWMLAEAIALLERGVPVELTGADPRHERQLIQSALDLARAADAPKAIRALMAMIENPRALYGEDRIEFVDHYARERGRGR